MFSELWVVWGGLPEVVEVVEVVRRRPVRDVILDGETLLLDENDSPRPFPETMSRFGAERVSRCVRGIELRFARVKRYRAGKRPEDTDTIHTLRGLLRA